MNATAALLALTTAFTVIACPPWEAAAAEPKAPNPTGTWTLTTSTGGAKTKTGSERTLKLKVEGGQVSGTFTKVSLVNGKAISKERKIEDAVLRGTEISFTVTFPVEAGDGPDVTTKYRGQINGATMQGKLETEWMGNLIKKDWEAKQQKN